MVAEQRCCNGCQIWESSLQLFSSEHSRVIKSSRMRRGIFFISRLFKFYAAAADSAIKLESAAAKGTKQQKLTHIYVLKNWRAAQQQQQIGIIWHSAHTRRRVFSIIIIFFCHSISSTENFYVQNCIFTLIIVDVHKHCWWLQPPPYWWHFSHRRQGRVARWTRY